MFGVSFLAFTFALTGRTLTLVLQDREGDSLESREVVLVNLDTLAIGKAAKDSHADQHKENLLGSLRHGSKNTQKKKPKKEKKNQKSKNRKGRRKKKQTKHNWAELEMIRAEKESVRKKAIVGSMHFFVAAHTFGSEQHQLCRACFPRSVQTHLLTSPSATQTSSSWWW